MNVEERQGVGLMKKNKKTKREKRREKGVEEEMERKGKKIET